VVLPEVEAMVGVEQPPAFHPEGDVFGHTALTLEALEAPSAVRAFGALLHDVGKPPTFSETDRIRFNNHDAVGAALADAVCKRLRFSTDMRRRIVEIVRNHMRFMHAPEMRESTLKRLLRRETFEDELAVHRADCLACHGDMTVYDFLVEKQAELPAEVIKPAPLVTGHDLIAAGYEAGPLFGEILTAVEDLQLEGTLTTSEEVGGEALRVEKADHVRARNAQPLHAELLAEVDLAGGGVVDEELGGAADLDDAFVDDVAAVHDGERLAHVVVGEQHADAALAQLPDDFLHVEDGDGVHAAEGLVEHDEAG
jgi:putative nucleotidyltransferase with HDIG domain